MATILVVGAESVVGANVAAQLAAVHHVRTAWVAEAAVIGGCENAGVGDRPSPVLDAVEERPDAIVLCGAAARSSWNGGLVDAEFARRWASTASDIGCALTYVSTDAVFDGPCLFHDVHDEPARTAESRAALLAEQAVLQEDPARS